MKEYKSKKEFKLDLINLSPIEIYEEVLSGRYIKIFPKNYWDKPDSLENAKTIMKYFIENKLNVKDIKELPNKISFTVIKKYKLYGIINYVFNYSQYEAINYTYPGVFREWEFKSIIKWNKNNAKEAIKWLIEEKLGIKNLDDQKDRNKLIKNYNQKLFLKYKLRGILNAINYSSYEILNMVYPNKFKPWELENCPNNYWNDDTIRESIIWLVEEKLKLTCDDYDKVIRISRHTFSEYGLGTVIHKYFGDSVFKALDFVYPNVFKYSDFKFAVYETRNNNIYQKGEN